MDFGHRPFVYTLRRLEPLKIKVFQTPFSFHGIYAAFRICMNSSPVMVSCS